MAFTRPRAAQIDFDVTNISDPLIRLNSAETGSADKDVGIVIERGDDTNVAVLYDESADQFVLVNTTEDGSTSGNVTISSYAGLQANAIVYGSLNDGTTTLTATATELNYLDGVTGITLGTANELLIVGSDGTSIISDSTLSIDTGSNYIGINQSSPEVTLHMTGEGAQTAQIRMEQYNDSADAPDVRTRRYRGTIASPSAIQSGDYLFRSNHEYYNGSALIVGGQFAFDNTNNANRTQFTVAVTTDGTSVEASSNDDVQFKIDGNDSGAITFNNAYKFPTSDGSANQVLQTDGSGALSFASISSTINLAGDSGTDAYTTGSTLTFSGTANEITTAVTDDTVTISLPDNVTIGQDLTVTGNLTVSGTTTTISTTNSVVSDSLIELNTGAGSNANDLGIVMERGSTGDNAIFAWDESADAFVMGTTTATGESTGDLTIANGELRLDTLRIDQSGTGLRMTNVGAFDNDGSDNFRIFATNDLQLKANGDSGGGLSIDVTNNDVTIDNDLRVSAGQFYYGGTAVTSTATELNILDGVTATSAELNLLDGVTGTLVTEAGTQTLTNKTLTSPTLTSPSVNTEAKMLAQAELEFYDSDSSNYVSFRGPATVATNITWTLPNTDGTEDQVLSTNGAGTLAWADAGSGGGGSGSSYPNSTFSTVPGTDGNFDMSYNVAQTSQETPFESGGTDAFGVNLGSVFSCMDPIGTTESIDYADGEAYVGA